MNPTSAQVSGMSSMTLSAAVTWLVTFILGKLAATGFLNSSDVPQLGIVLVIIGSAGWGYWANRPTAILQKAGSVVGDDGKKTIVIASPELASAVPIQNVISNAENKVVRQ